MNKLPACENCGHSIIKYKGVWLHVEISVLGDDLDKRINTGVVRCHKMVETSKKEHQYSGRRGCHCIDPKP